MGYISIFLLYLLSSCILVHAQTKTLQIEYIGVDSDDAFGTLSAVILGCLIEDDAMVFPVAIDYDDLLMMSKWSSHYELDLSDLSKTYFGIISFKLKGPYPHRVVEVIEAEEKIGSAFDDWKVYMDGPLILDVVYDDISTSYVGQVVIPPASLQEDDALTFKKKPGTMLRYTLEEKSALG